MFTTLSLLAPQAKILGIMEVLRSDFFRFSAPQAKILRIMEVLKPDFSHFSAPQAKFFEV